ncbi:MAG: hypothetical protein AcusKO_02680 [Acuticoccus sp.]
MSEQLTMPLAKNVGVERAQLTPFEPPRSCTPPRRDQRDLMERPFFSLTKSRRSKPILYKAGDVEVQVYAVPEHGMASIWDADAFCFGPAAKSSMRQTEVI